MHHGGGQGGVIQGLLLAALMVTASVHLGGRFIRHHRVDGYLVGHTLMAAGMGWMLLPGSSVSGPPTALAVVFGVGTGWFAALMVRDCRGSLWTGTLRYGDLVVGFGAMAYMLSPPTARFGPLTAVLVGYFVLLGLAAVGLVLGRSVTIELPEEMSTATTGPPAPGRLSRLTECIPTRSALAHASMAAAMVHMLARL